MLMHTQGNQSDLFAAQAYIRQNMQTEISPARLPIAAFALNAWPNSHARMNEIGPDVSGRPINNPLITAPQRRPANVTSPIMMGVMNNLNAKIGTLFIL
jgi:hypothetical protein